MEPKKPHLQERRDDWESALETEIVDALLDPQPFVCPFFISWARTHRPNAVARYLKLHADLGGYLGLPARRWMKQRRRR
jgi:hypothetical protein